jgi:Ni/Fe-hydrogenase subunit HybB-like protein
MMKARPDRAGPEIGAESPSVIAPGLTYAGISDQLSGIVLAPSAPRGWMVGFGIALALVMVLLYAVTYLFTTGVGIWGINIPVAWAFDITNFVWWIGIGHAGTLISAILLLMRLPWRTSIARFAEAMTVFAVANAGLFPLLHLGRPSRFYYLLPYPNVMGLWPQFRSPLVWDVFAVLTYFTVSVIFWFIGMVPDLATIRDRASRRVSRIIYGFLAMGWRGSTIHWQRYESAYWLLALLATPLVVSVHSIVSLDFAVSILPGWHTTVFPPYFVAGAIFSGLAMVLVLTIPLRKYYGLDHLITKTHLDSMAKLMLVTGLIVTYAYAQEAFMSWYSGDPFERYVVLNRALGPYAWVYWATLVCNVVAPQPLWFKRIRQNNWALMVISLLVLVGMWLERFMIIVISLHRDYLPSAWGMFYPTIWDWAVLSGVVGLFIMYFFLFIRFLPMVSMAETRRLIHDLQPPGEER